VIGAALYIFALLLLVFTPPSMAFPLCLLSRVLDALAEALFSGSDVALV
jgi:hypothetical protein